MDASPRASGLIGRNSLGQSTRHPCCLGNFAERDRSSAAELRTQKRGFLIQSRQLRHRPEISGVTGSASFPVTPEFPVSSLETKLVNWEGELRRDQWNLFSLKVLTRLAQAKSVKINVKVDAEIEDTQNARSAKYRAKRTWSDEPLLTNLAYPGQGVMRRFPIQRQKSDLKMCSLRFTCNRHLRSQPDMRTYCLEGRGGIREVLY
jgi:hypothetical protein